MGKGGKVSISRKAKWTLLSLTAMVPMGFSTKFYHGPAEEWVNDSLGGVFYVIFWCLLFFLFWKDARPWFIAILVFVATCFLEFLQLWHPPILEFCRSFFLGQTILGVTFSRADFPYYFLGGVLGWLWMRCLRNVAGGS